MNELFYKCEKCGNMVALIKSGGGTLSCCGQEMTLLKANIIDASKEKHVPVVMDSEGKIKVAVGSAAHPMAADHFIEWIALVSDDKIEIVHLKPGMAPKAEFTYSCEEEKIPYTGKNENEVPNCEGQPCNFVYNQKTVNEASVYAYCNLHGLWKTEL